MNSDNFISWQFAKSEDSDDTNKPLELAEEDYSPQLADEDYSVARTVVPSVGLSHVNITERDFYKKVSEAFAKRMRNILTPDKIMEDIDSEVYRRCLRNKYKEVTKDNNNETLSQEKVIRGHVASLMHCLYLVFAE